MTRHAGNLARRQSLDPLFAPRTIAVIGASDKERSVGRALLENLDIFEGPVFPVNPKHSKVLGKRCYPAISVAPDHVDLAVIATPASTVPAIVRECVQRGVGSAIVISAGFRECGNEGADLERQIREAAKGKLRLLGPNCLGLMAPASFLNATFAAGLARPGNIAFISQSGALCSAVLDWSFRENVGFSAFVSVGSMLDISWGDLITYLGDDPQTKSILCYMESIGDARRFLSAAREVALTKPIIVLKVGHTEAAAKAAASHTGAMTGSDAVLDAAFRRVGILRVNTINELFDMAEVLAKQPRPQGPRLAIVTNAGGAGALATDMLITNGGKLAELSAATLHELDKVLPLHWSHGNPIDILGDADAERYSKAIQVVSCDPQTDSLLVVLTPQRMTDATATADRLRACSKEITKPLLASWMGGAALDAGRAILNSCSVPTFEYADSAARAFALMWRYKDNLRAIYERPAIVKTKESAVTRRKADQIIQRVLKTGRTLLTEVESKRLLSCYGIDAVETHAAHSEGEAVRRATKLGFPVVIKLLSETITHKARVGGVCLNVRNPRAVREAWRSIRRSVEMNAGKHHFSGVTVQPMVSEQGYEILLGSTIDPQFGPVLVFGAGGRLVETLHDTAIGLPPLNSTLARRLMEQTRIYPALAQPTQAESADIAALEETLIRFSYLVAEQPRISEVDINPLFFTGRSVLALDARVILHPPATPEECLPKLAIRPYPSHYATTLKLRDGTSATVRPIRPDDEPRMVQFHKGLSDQSVYQRYFTPLKLEQRIAHERLSRVCFVDYDREMVFVVERQTRKTGPREIIAVGRLSKIHGLNEGEFALLVLDRWQRQGLGLALLNLLVRVGRDEKLDRICATILPDNRGMIEVARKQGFAIQQPFGNAEWQAELVLQNQQRE